MERQFGNFDQQRLVFLDLNDDIDHYTAFIFETGFYLKHSIKQFDPSFTLSASNVEFIDYHLQDIISCQIICDKKFKIKKILLKVS